MTTTITLESIKAAYTKLAEMIAAFEKQQEASILHIPEAIIKLTPGERYAGIITGESANPSYHLVLLPNQVENADWEEAKAWATGQGGDLPTRREQALLYANLKEEFEERAYWSCEAHESDFGWAWYQYFYDGYQDSLDRSSELRARAVRRIPIIKE